MSARTVEAIQAKLEGLGVVLIPCVPESPPPYLDDAYIHELSPRVFENANTDGPIHFYERSEQTRRWVLVMSVS